MYVLFGTIFIVGKIGIQASQPYFLTSMRMFLAGSLILGYLFLTKKSCLRVPKKLWKIVFLIAFFNVALTNAFEFWGLQYMNAGKTSLIYSLSLFISAIFAYFSCTEQMTLKKWIGLFVGIIPLSPLMLEPWTQESFLEYNSLELLAEGALLISAVTCVIGGHFFKKITVTHQI